MAVRNRYYIILIIAFGVFACGRNNKPASAYKKIEITITGLDGNEVAEKNISSGLKRLDGVEAVTFNYLNNQVVVLFDTVKVSQSVIVETIQKMDNGRYKILDVKENKESREKIPPVEPDPQEDIHDDISDEYKDNV